MNTPAPLATTSSFAVVRVDQLTLDHQLAALARRQPAAAQQWAVERRRTFIADFQLAGEGGLLNDAEDEPEHVVEQPGDDPAVGSARRSLVSGAERHRRLDLIAHPMDIEVDTPRAGGAGERAVVVGLDGGAAVRGLELAVPHLLDRPAARRTGVEPRRQPGKCRGDVVEQLFAGLVTDEGVADPADGLAGSPTSAHLSGEVV